jgi:hypothetical protein
MVTNGGYAGHGETYLHPEDILWWSKGGVLRGESWPRIGFLRQIIEAGPAEGLTPMEERWEWTRVSGGRSGDYRLIYLGEHQPRRWATGFPEDDGPYEIDIIDTWNMTITPASPGERPVSPPTRGNIPEAQPAFGVELPAKPYLAVRIRRSKPV